MKHVDMRKLAPAAQEERRRQVIGLRQNGVSYAAIAAQVGLSQTGVFDSKWGKSPGRFGDRPYRSAIGRQKLAESRARCSDFERMLHLRARTFAPITFDICKR